MVIHICEYSCDPRADTAALRGSLELTVQQSAASGAAPIDFLNQNSCDPMSMRERADDTYVVQWHTQQQQQQQQEKGEMAAQMPSRSECSAMQCAVQE